MNILITAGNTQTPIDRVRCITNVFSGRTGAAITRTAWGRGHVITLLTSRPDVLTEFGIDPRAPGERMTILPFETFDDLATLFHAQLKSMPFDAVCHTAAVSDYLSAGAFTPDSGTFFNARTGEWWAKSGSPHMTEEKAAKLKSTEPELWLRLVRAPKLIDRVRNPWGYTGILVKFKLEVGVTEAELLEVAEASRKHSAADLMVANTLDAVAHWAYLGPRPDRMYDRVARRELPDRLVAAVEDLYQERKTNG